MSGAAAAAAAPIRTARRPDLLIGPGQVTALRLFDIACAIDLRRAEARCGPQGLGSVVD